MKEFSYSPLATAEKVHTDPHELIAVVGPWGSGKSTIGALDLYQHCLKFNCDALVVRDTYPALRDSCVKKFMEIFADAGTLNHGPPPTFHWKGALKGREVMFRSAEHAEDIQKFGSTEVGYAWMEEVTPGLLPGGALNVGMAPEILSGVLGRIRKWFPHRETEECRISKQKSGKDLCGHRRILLSALPPPTTRHWFYALFYDRRPLLKGVDESVIKTLTDQIALYRVSPNENQKNLPLGYYETQTAFLTSDDQVQRFINGEVGAGYGSAGVYAENWSDELHIANIEASPGEMILGIDGGLDASAVWLQIQPSGRLYVLAELPTHGLGLEDFGYAVNQYGNQLFGPRKYKVWSDPALFARSQNDAIDGSYYLGKAGIHPRPGPQDPKVRIQSVRGWLARMGRQGALFQISPRCELLIEGFRGAYHFKQTNGMILVNLVEKNEFSHPHDALQYPVAALSRRSTSPTALPRLPSPDSLGRVIPLAKSIGARYTRRRSD